MLLYYRALDEHYSETLLCSIIIEIASTLSSEALTQHHPTFCYHVMADTARFLVVWKYGLSKESLSLTRNSMGVKAATELSGMRHSEGRA